VLGLIGLKLLMVALEQVVFGAGGFGAGGFGVGGFPRGSLASPGESRVQPYTYGLQASDVPLSPLLSPLIYRSNLILS
jgi:hypothetical protein